FVVHKTTLRQERRKEKREATHKVCIELRELERLAINFHVAQEHDSRNATDLRQSVVRLIRHLQRAPLTELEIPNQSLILLRQSITRNNADPSDFSAQAPDSDLVRNIRDATSDLIEVIEDGRERKWK
ncbi:MAG: hypothetical protein Q8J70_01585, partial [Thiobacillus sp.]|nr:hypothetical protein [Thiobacillus sp.]